MYIVPPERFCREMGPALGVNLAEFEFPAYFNFFVYKKQCTLVVDSEDAEENIRRVFEETLLGPAQFRGPQAISHEPEDFAPEYPREAIPNLANELEHFRMMPDGSELGIDMLLKFRHFDVRSDDELGVPPPPGNQDSAAEVYAKESDDEVLSSDNEALPKDGVELEARQRRKKWTYSKAKFMGTLHEAVFVLHENYQVISPLNTGDVATIYPSGATPEQIAGKSVPRVEIFKMPGGTEYIIHDIDVENFIVGKARFSGHVKVSEAMSVDGFGGHSIMDDLGPNAKKQQSVPSFDVDSSERSYRIDTLADSPKTFYPPSFGVTVLGNSHGFDKGGSVSGYVLWVNGRGIMIDPPPYSSATLEREGIRPRLIVGIILTHCHADHDAGAFQKVLTGSPVVVITTPTIYKSFIRKYAALSALSPALLRHSHRFKPAIIGQPLRFQGATFNFTYTLHSIPCIGFRVDWRGRSMVFTGDHFNNPPALEKLQEKGVLSKARKQDLNNLPLQETDLLLHEAGAPPIHTPLEVLNKLPARVKKRMYVVHTSALPADSELKVAPTGTKGTIRLDRPSSEMNDISEGHLSSGRIPEDEDVLWNNGNEYNDRSSDTLEEHTRLMASYSNTSPSIRVSTRGSVIGNSIAQGFRTHGIPLVSTRPASSTDAWFTLNLLSAVPFLSSLSYTSTMEVLETAKVDSYHPNEVVVPAAKRSQILCVIWEGTCAERPSSDQPTRDCAVNEDIQQKPAVWHAGDWTGPVVLQPERCLSSEGVNSASHDVVAVSSEGVKVITIEFSQLHSILRTNSGLYRKYLDRKKVQEEHRSSQRRTRDSIASSEGRSEETSKTEQLLVDAMANLNILELLNCNSALRKLTAVQKRHLESLAEGPISFQPGERIWRAGAPVDKAFLLVSGTASFVPKRRNAGSAAAAVTPSKENQDKIGDPSVGDSMRDDAQRAMKELGVRIESDEVSSMSSAETERLAGSTHQLHFDELFNKSAGSNTHSLVSEANEFARLSRGLQKRAEYLKRENSQSEFSLASSDASFDTENESQIDYTFTDEGDPGNRSRRSSVIRRRSSRARYANKVLGRLYSRRAFTGGLVFSRGHFLGDASKMVAGILASDTAESDELDYGFGDSDDQMEKGVRDNLSEMIIHEQEGDHHIMHSSTLTAGKDGCVLLVFPKTSLIPFLDEYPGLLLSLLGTQVVV